MHQKENPEIKRLIYQKNNLITIFETIKAILEESDPDVISVYIDVLQSCSDNLSRECDYPRENVRNMILNGQGIFIEIQDKCMSLNLV